MGPSIGVGVVPGREGCQYLEAKREGFGGEVLGQAASKQPSNNQQPARNCFWKSESVTKKNRSPVGEEKISFDTLRRKIVISCKEKTRGPPLIQSIKWCINGDFVL